MGLKLNAANGGGSVELDVPATVSSDVVLTLPDADGDVNQILQTDGSGALSWTTGLRVKQVVSNNMVNELNVGNNDTVVWSQSETTITPTSHTNPILVLIHSYYRATSSATRGDLVIKEKIAAGSYSNISGNIYLYTPLGAGEGYHFNEIRWRNPTRTAGQSITYALQLTRNTGSDSIILAGQGSYPANITLIEFEGTTEQDGA